MITPNYEPHKKLEADVKSYLESKGYLIYEATYHAVATTEIKDILQNRFTPTGLYLRGRADRTAVHQVREIEFEFECKTHKSPTYDDMTIEMLPLVHHLSKAKLDVTCLYAYRHKERDYGFWVSDLPRIRQIWIPPLERNNIPWFEGVAKRWFPGVEIVVKAVGGTGDPYIIIDKSVVSKLLDWKDLITNIEVIPKLMPIQQILF